MASIFFRTIIIYLLLSISMKLMGKRQIGELDLGDLISTLLISELAAIPIDDPNIPLLNAVIPIFLIVSLEIIISAAKNRFNVLKKYTEDDPVFIVFKGELLQKTLKDNRISLNEFLMQIRTEGIGDIEDIEYCCLEQNGKLSLIQKQSAQGNFVHPLIIDGDINYNEAKLMKISPDDISDMLGGVDIKTVFLMTLDDFGKKSIIIKENT